MTEPSTDPTPPSPHAPAFRPRRLALQLLAFAVGLALLAFTISIAFGEKNREQIEKLKDATWQQIALLLGLSLVSLLVNGVMFWVALRPVRRLHVADVVSTNCIAAFLGYLPMKLGLILRIAIHVRRDRVPLLTVTAWFASVAIVMLGVVGVLLAASLATKDLNALWFTIAIGGLALGGGVLVLLARLFAGDAGLARLDRLLRALRLPLLPKIVQSERYRQLHAAADMLADPKAVFATVALRVVDFALQAARVPVAAGIIGLSLPYTQAFMISATAFLVGIVSPGGPVGSREAAVYGVCELLSIPNAESFALVALLVTGTEGIAYAIGAALSLAWMRPTKLFTPRTPRTP